PHDSKPAMKTDIRTTALYQEIEGLCKAVRQPGSGQISDASEVHASPDGGDVVFAGAILDRLEGTPPTRICATETTSGTPRRIPGITISSPRPVQQLSQKCWAATRTRDCERNLLGLHQGT